MNKDIFKNIISDKREISGLVEAMKYFNLSEGIILTSEVEKEVSVDRSIIKIIPLWKWLLNI